MWLCRDPCKGSHGGGLGLPVPGAAATPIHTSAMSCSSPSSSLTTASLLSCTMPHFFCTLFWLSNRPLSFGRWVPVRLWVLDSFNCMLGPLTHDKAMFTLTEPIPTRGPCSRSMLLACCADSGNCQCHLLQAFRQQLMSRQPVGWLLDSSQQSSACIT